jgi:hypothetical protein
MHRLTSRKPSIGAMFSALGFTVSLVASPAPAQVETTLVLSQDAVLTVRADLYVETTPGESWHVTDIDAFHCVAPFGVVNPLDNPTGPWGSPMPDTTPAAAPSDTFLMGPGGLDGTQGFLFMIQGGFSPPCDVEGPAWAEVGVPSGLSWIARFSIPLDQPYHPGYTLATLTGASSTLSGATVPFRLAIVVPPPTPCPVDFDGDGDTDQADLGVLLSGYGCTSGFCKGDLDGDGDTDQADLGIMLSAYGCGL